jgi:hypothetical protein
MAPGRSSRPEVRGSPTGAASATAMPIGTLTNSTQRHEAYVTSRPLASSPAAVPATLIAAYTPIARRRGGPCANVVAISVSAADARIALPAPWTARAASSHA